MIRLEKVTKLYGSTTAVNAVNTFFEKSQTTVIIGPSGCGKSTILKLITGLIKADKGEIKINNQNLAEVDLRNFRKSIGYVIQEGGLFDHLSIEDNLKLAPHNFGESSQKINERIEYLTGLTKLDKKQLVKYPAQLSGGQRQRVSLMRALMLDPEILLLDEPLGALDPLIRFELQSDLKEIFSELKKTVVMVTHDLSEAVYFADRIILMKDGKIVQSGAPNRLLKNPSSEFVKKFITAQRSYVE
ncbi:MAG: ABC transporter ATP-binding protein [Ignavibacteria bacterium]